MKRLFFISICFLLLQISFGQKGTAGVRTSLNRDSSIKIELEYFKKHKDPAVLKEGLNARLIEIPLLQCSDNDVQFSLSKFNSSVSTFIHLYFKGALPQKKLDSLFVVTHSHFWVKMPKGALEGIVQNLPCEVSDGGKKRTLVSPYYKAYYSADKRRMYIHMIGRSAEGQYEVTWVFADDKYLMRVLDRL